MLIWPSQHPFLTEIGYVNHSQKIFIIFMSWLLLLTLTLGAPQRLHVLGSSFPIFREPNVERHITFLSKACHVWDSREGLFSLLRGIHSFWGRSYLRFFSLPLLVSTQTSQLRSPLCTNSSLWDMGISQLPAGNWLLLVAKETNGLWVPKWVHVSEEWNNYLTTVPGMKQYHFWNDAQNCFSHLAQEGLQLLAFLSSRGAVEWILSPLADPCKKWTGENMKGFMLSCFIYKGWMTLCLLTLKANKGHWLD